MTAAVGGVDGARGAWVLVSHTDDGWSVQGCEQFTDVVAAATSLGLAAVGVDMPIGLPATTPRASDVEARQLLGARRSTLFPTPVEAVMSAGDYADALSRSRAADGRGLSKQAFNLLPMIRQVRATVAPDSPVPYVEVHPDTTFTVLAGRPLASKKTAAGVGQRLAVLQRFCPDATRLLAHAPSGVGVDDVLDATVVAVSAARYHAGAARILGHGVDNQGYSLCIVA